MVCLYVKFAASRTLHFLCINLECHCKLPIPAVLARLSRQVVAQCLSALLGVQEALSALATLTVVSKRDNNEIMEHLTHDARPPPPEAETLLPTVHTTWGFMPRSLELPAPAARTEAAARLLAHVAVVAGSFVASRFARDALPLLLRALRGAETVSLRNSAAAPQRVEGASAPGTRERQSRAVLQCIVGCCEDAEGRHVFQDHVAKVADAVLRFLCAAESAAVAQHATRCVLALAQVDADAVWLVVAQLLQRPGCANAPSGADSCAGACGGNGDLPRVGTGWQGKIAELCRCCEQLFESVCGCEVAWHCKVREAGVVHH